MSAHAPRFDCAAPWFEAVVRMDGEVRPCCRSDVSFGHLSEDSLAARWQGKEATAFRREIAAGRPPTTVCRDCHRSRKHSHRRKVLDPLIARGWTEWVRALAEAWQHPDAGLCVAVTQFHQAVRDDDDDRVQATAASFMATVDAQRGRVPQGARALLARLRMLAQAAADHALRTLQPRVVGLLRQVSLVAVCNARCIHCVGLYNDEIRLGQWVGGVRRKRIAPDLLEAALAPEGHVAGFFLNGSEFFLYPQWRGLLQRMERAHIRIGVASNGLLLDQDAIETLTTSRALRDISLSFDGACASTVERIRVGVGFERLCETARAVLEALDRHGRDDVALDLSMVLMRDNRHEAAALVELAHTLGRGLGRQAQVGFQVLDATPQPAYQHFRAAQYTDIQDAATRAYLVEAAAVALRLGVAVHYAYEGPLQGVLEQPAGPD